VKVARRRYVDGAIRSPSNLDLLCGEGLDLVICLNPMSSQVAAPSRSPGDRIGALTRAEANRRLARELRRLRGTGIEVLVLEPTSRDLWVMGWNLMARGRCMDIVETAMETTSLALRRLRGSAQLLPGGSRGRRGPIPASRGLRAAA
jgi:NTE family protein